MAFKDYPEELSALKRENEKKKLELGQQLDVNANKIYDNLTDVRSEDLDKLGMGYFTREGDWVLGEDDIDEISSYWELFYLNYLHNEQLKKTKNNSVKTDEPQKKKPILETSKILADQYRFN